VQGTGADVSEPRPSISRRAAAADDQNQANHNGNQKSNNQRNPVHQVEGIASRILGSASRILVGSGINGLQGGLNQPGWTRDHLASIGFLRPVHTHRRNIRRHAVAGVVTHASNCKVWILFLGTSRMERVVGTHFETYFRRWENLNVSRNRLKKRKRSC